MFDVHRRRRPAPRRAVRLAAAAVAFAAGCGGRAAPPPEQATELMARHAPAAAPAPAPGAAEAVEFTEYSGGPVAADAAVGVTGGVPAAVLKTVGLADSTGTAATAATAVTAGAPMLIRTGTASVEVDSLEAAVARVRALAAHVGGYVASTSLAAGGSQTRSATLELRVPAARFEEVVGGLAPFGRVERVDVQAQDVGEEFVDVTARVANARRLEARLVDLLARRTGKLEEVLAVERQLARVREEIERYEGRLRYLRTRSATSTLTVSVHERAPLLAAAPDATPIADAFRAAGRNFVALLTGLIAASGVGVPVGALAYVVWRWRRRSAAPAVSVRGGPRAASAS